MSQPNHGRLDWKSPVMVLNDSWTASASMCKTADVYSSKPMFPIPGQILAVEETNQMTHLYEYV